MSPNVLTGYGPSWPVKKEANTAEVHRDALAETCKQCWNRVDFFVNILDSQTDMSRLKPQSTVYLKWPGNWGEYPMFRQPTILLQNVQKILHKFNPCSSQCLSQFGLPIFAHQRPCPVPFFAISRFRDCRPETVDVVNPYGSKSARQICGPLRKF